MPARSLAPFSTPTAANSSAARRATASLSPTPSLYEYAGAIDAKEFDRLDAVFTPDADIDYRAFGGIAGAYPEIKAWLSKVLPTFPAYQHMIGNAEISIAGDQARGRVMCLNPMAFPGKDGTV